jgi:SHS2 domain-containing protein
MYRFTFLGHTADTRLKLEATSHEELFQAGLEGLATLIHPSPLPLEPEVSYELSLQSSDSTALIIDFLAEVLTLSHIHKAIFTKIHFKNFSPTALEAEIKGTKVDRFEKDVKAVTYHEANITKNDQELFETIVIFDI